jgi:hypothetical protein
LWKPPIRRHRARHPTHLAHDALELATGLREIVSRAAAASCAFQHAGVDELAQTRREHRARDAWDAAPYVAESVASTKDFANDEERPSFAEDVERTRNRAELTEGFHGINIRALRSRPGTDSVPPHFVDARGVMT